MSPTRTALKAAVPIAMVAGEVMIPFSSLALAALFADQSSAAVSLGQAGWQVGASVLAGMAGNQIQSAWKDFSNRRNSDLQRAAARALRDALREIGRDDKEYKERFEAWTDCLDTASKGNDADVAVLWGREEADNTLTLVSDKERWLAALERTLRRWEAERKTKSGLGPLSWEEIPALEEDLRERLRDGLWELVDRQFSEELEKNSENPEWVAFQKVLLQSLHMKLDSMDRKLDLLVARNGEFGQLIHPVNDQALWNVAPATPNFGFRDDLLLEIGNALDTHRVVALHGVGGAGKSQVAQKYVWDHRDKYTFVRWIPADRLVLGIEWAKLARALGLDVQHVEEARIAVLGYLSSERTGWLLVFDSVPDANAIAPYLPVRSAGSVLITSQSSVWGPVRAASIAVRSWDLATGTQFLCSRVPGSDLDAATSLAGKLGSLPLALEQAAAFCEAGGCGFDEYERSLSQVPRQLLDQSESVGHVSVWKTANRALEELDGVSPGAVELIQLLAFFGPEEIPEWMFVEHKDLLPESLRKPLDWLKAKQALSRFSLVNMRQQFWSVHKVTQLVARSRLGDKASDWAAAAVRLAHAAFPYENRTPETWPRSAELVGAAISSSEHAEQWDVAVESRMWLDTKVAWYLQIVLSALPEALIFMFQSLKAARALHGFGHPQTTARMEQFGQILMACGHLRDAQRMTESAVRINEELVGPEHQIVALGANSLGQILRAQGKLGEARIQTERAVRLLEQVRPLDTLHLATAINNLGQILADLGDLNSARERTEKALRLLEGVGQEGKPTLAAVASNLGSIMYLSGEYTRARELTEYALKANVELFGEGHPAVARDTSNLGRLMVAMGCRDEARAHFQRAIASLERTVGSDHPDTLAVRGNLAALD